MDKGLDVRGRVVRHVRCARRAVYVAPAKYGRVDLGRSELMVSTCVVSCGSALGSVRRFEAPKIDGATTLHMYRVTGC